MKRTMFQVYLTDCDAAIAFYTRAFGATVDAVHRDPEGGDPQGGAVLHAEIRAFGQCIAFSERSTQTVAGNTMQFCFHLGEGHEETVRRAYEVLREGAAVDYGLAPCDWSPSMFSLVDRFGVNWCIFV